MKILERKELEQIPLDPSWVDLIEEGLIALSQKQAVLGPTGFLHLHNPAGSVHIKYGSFEKSSHYIVKIASHITDSNGALLLFSRKTGSLEVLLHDQGYLTNLRTGLAGAVMARAFAPPDLDCIGFVGAGSQAHFQLSSLSLVSSCRKGLVWSRNQSRLESFISAHPEYQLEIAPSIAELCKKCRLIITTTASQSPLIQGAYLQPGTHITAIGADEAGKQELDPSVFSRADLIITDSLTQCIEYGDLSHAPAAYEKAIEYGAWRLSHPNWKRPPASITVADLTGLAIEDLLIAEALAFRTRK